MQAARGTSLNPLGDPHDDPTPPARRRRVLLFSLVAFTAYLADVLSKVAAVHWLEDRTDSVVVVPHVLHLTLTRNPGAAFSMATGFTAVLTAVAVAVCVVVVKMSSRLRDPWWAVALGLLLGGALGNLTDRFVREPSPLRGHVVDWLQFPDFPPNWPIFNLADSCIVLAAIVIAVQSFRGIALDGSRADHREDGDGAAS